MALATCSATVLERRRPLPVDAMIPEAIFTSTHAITIDAPPERVWPWIVQMGSDRAGWYSWDAIDNGGRPSATSIVPAFQTVVPSDIMPAVPGANDAFVVAAVDPPRDLVLTVPDGHGGHTIAWEHHLEPLDSGHTRLIVRGRASSHWLDRAGAQPPAGRRRIFIERAYAVLARLPRPLLVAVAGFGHRTMEARHLRGIRRLAEGPRRTTAFPGNVTYFGATKDELEMPLPGDDIVATPVLETTHALTIDAPPEAIWPWLMQIGQGRAGFYSDSSWWDTCVDFYYRVLAREQGGEPVRYRPRNTERIVPAWQDLRVGDAILDGPPGTACYIVRQIEPNRSLVLFTDTHLPYMLPAGLRSRVSGELSDTLLLVPLDSDRTRVIRRMRATCSPLAFRLVAVPLVLIWGELITARNFLRGLKRRAEAAQKRHQPRQL
jgi:hypothetical protein